MANYTQKVVLENGSELWFDEGDAHAVGPDRDLLTKLARSLALLYDTEAGNPQVRVLNWIAQHGGGTLVDQ